MEWADVERGGNETNGGIPETSVPVGWVVGEECRSQEPRSSVECAATQRGGPTVQGGMVGFRVLTSWTA